MTLDFLLRAFRKAFQNSAGQVPSDDTTKALNDDSLDPFNPFPDPVVVEFRDVLDLHAIPPKQVREVVEEYLQEAFRRGVPYLRIIHGKGIGVQRDLIRSLLAKTPFVIEYKDAPAEAGGWGATIVTLGIKKESR
jgi:dsDNA-specific endonuclease/ATPase MutS2